MPVNYVKEYLMFVQTGVVFLPFHVRVKNGRHYSNIEKKSQIWDLYHFLYIVLWQFCQNIKRSGLNKRSGWKITLYVYIRTTYHLVSSLYGVQPKWPY